MSSDQPKGFLLLTTFRFLIRVIPANLKRRGLVAVLTVFVNSLVDLLGLASLIPLFIVIIDENKIASSDFLQGLYHAFNFSDNRSFIVFLCLLVLIFIVIKNAFSILLNFVQFRYAFSLFRHFSSRLFSFYHSKGLLFLKNNNSNHLVNHINSVSLLFGQQVVVSFLGVVNELIIISLIILGIFLYEPRLILLFSLTLVPVFFLFFRIVKNKIHSLGANIQKTAIQLNKTLYEGFQGFTDIEVRNKAGWNFRKFTQYVNTMSHLQIKNQLFLQMPLKIIEVGIILGLVVTILLSLALQEDLSNLSLLLGIFGIAAYRILPSINRLMVYLMNIRNHQYTFEIIEKTTNKGISTDFDHDVSKRLSFSKNIRIENLSFSFGSQKSKILSDISFEIKKGEQIGIVGRSGSGKTTLLNILLRFYFPQSGKITVDGTELTSDNIVEWRNIVGYVPQEVFIMDASLAENVAFGEEPENIDYEKLDKVIALASLKDFVGTLSEGVKTPIGERGNKLSGGQKQRIGIARALYNDAEILFFDEATSSLDSVTEEEITNSIKYLSDTNKTLTILIIAHRLTTLKHCDRIIEFDAGRIAGEYSYEALRERV